MNHTISELEFIANEIRKDIILMLDKAGSGHPAGALGMTDVFTALYFEVLNHLPNDPTWRERDRVILSSGHINPVLYSTLARAGYFELSLLSTLRKMGSDLQGHPSKNINLGIENSSGPLGQGLSIAIGIALASKIDGLNNQIYCIMGDGEQNEGQVWEAYMFAGKNRINNLNAIIDRNNIQIDGFTEDVMPLEPFKQKLESFGWHVHEVDGNNIYSVINVLKEAKTVFSKPSAIIAHTVPGKGVSFMESNPEWHGKAPSGDDTKKALSQLDKNKYGII